jgi:hypothetical protein
MSAATQHRREVTSSCASGRVALTMHQHTREWMWSCCAKPQSSTIRLFWGKLSGKLSGKRVQQSGGTAMKRRFASSPNVPRSSRFPSLNLGRTALRRCTDWLAEYAVSLPEFGRFCGIQVGDVKLGEAQVLAYRPTDSFPFVQVPRRTLESDSCVLRVEELIAHRLRSTGYDVTSVEGSGATSSSMPQRIGHRAAATLSTRSARRARPSQMRTYIHTSRAHKRPAKF